MKYEQVQTLFANYGCKLLNNETEFNEIEAKGKNKKYRYIASCSHEHNVFFNVFLNRGTGILCPKCKNKENTIKQKQTLNETQESKISFIQQEYECIQYLINVLQNNFFITKAFDGCLVDIILKPKYIVEDKCIGIQIKTTKEARLTYSFHINNVYDNCLILCYCINDKNMWLFPENIIINQQKISMGYHKSKYNIYKVDENELTNKLNELYNVTTQKSFNELNRPTNIYQQREQDYREYRKLMLPHIPFVDSHMEGTPYDFKINSLKVQEKVAKVNDNKCIFQLCKNNGKRDGKINQIQYDIGDNDIYWLNCDNKETFFVIPESVLIEQNLIGNNKTKKFFKITIKDQLHKSVSWLQPYMFNYNNIDKERLSKLLNL
jgi:hypothetical protein